MESVPFGFLVSVIAALAFGFGIAADRFLLKRIGLDRLADARKEAQRLIEETELEIESAHLDRLARSEREIAERNEAFARETAETKKQFKRTRQKLEQRQDKLNKRTEKVNRRESLLHQAIETVDSLRGEAEQNHQMSAGIYTKASALLEYSEDQRQKAEKSSQEIEHQQERLQSRENTLGELVDTHRRKLEHISGLTATEAKQTLLEDYLQDVKFDSAARVKEIRDEARLKAARESRKIILTAIQRTAAGHTIENTVSVVNIHSDEMKGRIIGREGRNIRAFESTTGIEVIVDDTPEAVILSGFDPVRREVARIALTRLIEDGRIHPTRIEEVVDKTRSEIDEQIVEHGERTVIDLSLQGIHPELIRYIGRMRFRTSYGQNLLAHSIETARIASLMAAELGLDPALARRAGLLHDVGKVTEEPIESPHAIAGMELCKKFREDERVCNAVGAHHDEIEMTAIISPLIQAADAISGARPGARREALQSYVKRLEKLEELAGSFEGVERVFAMQAGREIRVIVNHDLVTDARAEQLSHDISSRIQKELRYPGQIKVTVIREIRSVSYAR
jgi:ribonucrease Y